MRLWDISSKPTVICSIHAPFSVTGAYANKKSTCRQIAVTGGKEVIVYTKELEKMCQSRVDAEITTVAFTGEDVIVGTKSGKICRLNATTGKQQRSFTLVKNKPVTGLVRFTGIIE